MQSIEVEEFFPSFRPTSRNPSCIPVIPCVTAMDGRNADFAGAKTCRPPWMAEVPETQERFPGKAGVSVLRSASPSFPRRRESSLDKTPSSATPVIPAKAGIHVFSLSPFGREKERPAVEPDQESGVQSLSASLPHATLVHPCTSRSRSAGCVL
jgi:hypothetical protein